MFDRYASVYSYYYFLSKYREGVHIILPTLTQFSPLYLIFWRFHEV